MAEYKDKTYSEERALFSSKDAVIERCIFEDGESPLKESKNIKVYKSTFKWKYPLWYCGDVVLENSTLEETARSGIWYTKDIKVINSVIHAPKTFRRAENIILDNVTMDNASETLWNCKDVSICNCKIKGDYLGINSENIEVLNLELEGNYLFDGSKNIVVKNSVLKSKDSFWNCENVTVINCTIIGEYLGWNSKNVTFINCHIESHQALCYMQNVKLVNCELVKSDLCFEYCSNVDADIITEIDSVKNPYSGIISSPKIKELILDEKYIDKNKVIIKTRRYEQI